VGVVVNIEEYGKRSLGKRIPQDWETQVEYRGDRRYIGWYWDPELRDYVITDGVSNKVPNPRWLILLMHDPKTAFLFESLTPTSQGHWYVVDRWYRELMWCQAPAARFLISRNRDATFPNSLQGGCSHDYK